MNTRTPARKPGRRAALLAVFLYLFAAAAFAAGATNIFDARVPMRDGTELSADVWLPAANGKFPAILIRTPYLKAGGRLIPFARTFAGYGYAVVLMDVRGRGDSDGAFLHNGKGEGEDGHDSIEWIAAQDWSNGDVCMKGGSYEAAAQWAAARRAPPHLRCIAPSSTGGVNGSMFVGGAMTGFFIQWVNIVSGRVDQRGVVATLDWEEILQHRPLLTMDEAVGRPMPLYRRFLGSRDPTDNLTDKAFTAEDYLRIRLPVLHVAGWFDMALASAMDRWRGMASNPQAAQEQFLLLGPWDHWSASFGGEPRLGEMEFTADAMPDLTALHRAFFDRYLKAEPSGPVFPRVRVYLTGSNRWLDLEAFPPRQSRERKLFLHSGGAANSLAGDGSLDWLPPESEPADHFVFNPRDPVPSSAGKEPHASDQRPIEERPDVLVYTGAALEEPLEIVGEVSLELYAASDARDTDFTAKLVDVHPDGRAIRLGTVNSGIVRARFRDGLERESLLTPGRVEKYRISLLAMGHTFLPGHRLRLEVSSSAYPNFIPNQNTGNPIESDTEWRVARQTIRHDRLHPSALILPVFD